MVQQVLAHNNFSAPCYPQYSVAPLTFPSPMPGFTPVIMPVGAQLPVGAAPLPFPISFPVPNYPNQQLLLPAVTPDPSFSPSPSPFLLVSPNTTPPPNMNYLDLQGGYLQQPMMPYSLSRSASPSLASDGSDTFETRERPISVGTEGEKSKKQLVDEALAELSSDFGAAFDTDGLRGQNILRIKVKTRVSLENIVPFIRFCQRENLLCAVSCPISTKKGRQHVRGFLAYLQTRNETDADRVCELFEEYNALNNSPFKAYQRNPKSTLYKTMIGAEA